MTKTTDILKAVRDKLKEHYPTYKVYLDEVVEDISSPCFILKVVDTVKDDGNFRVLHDGSLYITLFAQKGYTDAMTFYDIKDTLMSTFVRGLTVGKRHINFSNFSTNTTGEDADIVQITLPYSFYDTLDHEPDKYLMENIYTQFNA